MTIMKLQSTTAISGLSAGTMGVECQPKNKHASLDDSLKATSRRTILMVAVDSVSHKIYSNIDLANLNPPRSFHQPITGRIARW